MERKKKKEYIARELKTTVATTIPISIHGKAKKYNISWTDALCFGILWKFAELSGEEYPRNPLSDKISRIMEQLNAKCQECEALRVQLGSKQEAEK